MYAYGGVYLDSDVEPGEKALSDSKMFIKERNCLSFFSAQKLYLDNHSQGVGIGNDLLIASPCHAFFTYVLKLAVAGYKITSIPEYNELNYTTRWRNTMLWAAQHPARHPIIFHTKAQQKTSQEKNDFREKTSIAKTGNPVILQAIRGDYKNRYSFIDPEIKAAPKEGGPRSDRSWCTPHTKKIPAKEAFKTTVKTLEFEYNHMDIYRKEEVIDQYEEATGSTITDEQKKTLMKLAQTKPDEAYLNGIIR